MEMIVVLSTSNIISKGKWVHKYATFPSVIRYKSASSVQSNFDLALNLPLQCGIVLHTCDI